MDILQAIKHRISANSFDSDKKLSETEIKELIGYAIEAPSSFNIQHWRFIAVTDAAAKEKLKALAYNQPKVTAAAVTFIVLGDLKGHEKLPDIVGRAVKAGVIEQGVADYFVNGAAGFYKNYTDTQTVRDEAIRSATFAGMTLMLAAEAKGLVSGPMIGFDFEGVKKAFNISDRYVPAMLIAVGYPAPGNWPRKPRLAVDEVLAFNEGREF
jgi:nitroreductase